jgi:hypothetical protein
VGSKCFQLYCTCLDRLLTITLPSYSFHLFPPITVTFPTLSVILRPLNLVTGVSEGRYVYPKDGGYSSSSPEMLVALT